MRQKLGLKTTEKNDGELIGKLLQILKDEKADFTITFRRLSDSSSIDESGNFKSSEAFRDWAGIYRERLRAEDSDYGERKKSMDRVNPKFILRNYLAEKAIRKAVDEHDYAEIEKLHLLLRNPYSEQPEYEEYSKPSPEGARNIKISCSS
jgi:uncharacterized protein YdiU (UPF0061 family)